MQREWIGKRSEGAEIELRARGLDDDALRGLHDAPGHALRLHLLRAQPRASARRRAHDGRTARGGRGLPRARPARSARSSTARRRGQPPRRPACSRAPTRERDQPGEWHERVPLWIARLRARELRHRRRHGVPGHDERDFAFARTVRAASIPVVRPFRRPTRSCSRARACFTGGRRARDAVFELPRRAWRHRGEGPGSSSSPGWSERLRAGSASRQLSLRDWLFSRQRYWGEPFPIVHSRRRRRRRSCPTTALPVELPHLDDFKPTEDGRVRRSRAPSDWVEVVDQPGDG